MDDSEEAYETVEAEEPEIYAWESGATTYNSTELGWSYVDGAAKYRVYKYSPSKGKYVKYKDVTGTTVKVTGLKAGTSYRFMVASLVKKNGKYVLQNKSAEYTVSTSAKSSGSSTKDNTSVQPGKWNEPDLGTSLSSVLKTCGIGNYTVSNDENVKNGKKYSGLTYYGGELSGAALFFNSQNELYQYILTIPCPYSTFSTILSSAKSGFDYDYDYYEGYYFFGSSLYQLVLHYDYDGYMSWMVYSSYYEY